MRRRLAITSGLSLLSVLTALAVVPSAQAAGRAKAKSAGHSKTAFHRGSGIETSLLDIRVLQSYRDVLARYGQPTGIYRLDETPQFQEEYDANGKPTGAIVGLGDIGTSSPTPAGGAPRAVGAPGGFPGGGYPGGGYPGGGGGYPGGAGRGARPGGFPGGGGYPGGQGGFPGGGYPGGGYPGGGGAPGGAMSAPATQGLDPGTFGASGGYIWVYFYPKTKLIYLFGFNSDGRVEILVELGATGGKRTSHGLGLGDPIRKVYDTYGWPDTIEQQDVNIVLNYPQKSHVQFFTTNNKVRGISVVLKENEKFYLNGAGGAGGGPAAAGGGRRPGGGDGGLRPQGFGRSGGGGRRPGGGDGGGGKRGGSD